MANPKAPPPKFEPGKNYRIKVYEVVRHGGTILRPNMDIVCDGSVALDIQDSIAAAEEVR